MICPINLLRFGIVNMSDAALLECAGRAGTTGVTTVEASGECRIPHNTVHHCFDRLRDLGLVNVPTRDAQRGRVNRHVISPTGMALLQAPAGGIRHSAQLQLPIHSQP